MTNRTGRKAKELATEHKEESIKEKPGAVKRRNPGTGPAAGAKETRRRPPGNQAVPKPALPRRGPRGPAPGSEVQAPNRDWQQKRPVREPERTGGGFYSGINRGPRPAQGSRYNNQEEAGRLRGTGMRSGGYPGGARRSLGSDSAGGQLTTGRVGGYRPGAGSADNRSPLRRGTANPRGASVPRRAGAPYDKPGTPMHLKQTASASRPGGGRRRAPGRFDGNAGASQSPARPGRPYRPAGPFNDRRGPGTGGMRTPRQANGNGRAAAPYGKVDLPPHLRESAPPPPSQHSRQQNLGRDQARAAGAQGRPAERGRSVSSPENLGSPPRKRGPQTDEVKR